MSLVDIRVQLQAKRFAILRGPRGPMACAELVQLYLRHWKSGAAGQIEALFVCRHVHAPTLSEVSDIWPPGGSLSHLARAMVRPSG